MNFSQRFSFLLLKKPLSTGWLFSAKIFQIVVVLLLKIVDFHHKRPYNRIVKRLRETSKRKTNQKRRRKMEMSKASRDLLAEFEIFEMPKGWKITKGTMTQPVGYVWINNGQSLFAKDENGKRLFRQALIKEELAKGE